MEERGENDCKRFLMFLLLSVIFCGGLFSSTIAEFFCSLGSTFSFKAGDVFKSIFFLIEVHHFLKRIQLYSIG